MVDLPTELNGAPVHEMTAICYEMLGSAMVFGDQTNNWLLLKFLDAALDGLKPVWDMVTDSGLRPGWWDAFNAYASEGAQLPWLQWLTQFTGDIYDTSTIGIRSTDASPDQVNRSHVARRRNWSRGTVHALEEIVLERTPQGSSVKITERYNGDPATVLVTVTTADMPQNLQAELIQALSASLPAGDVLIFQPRLGVSYAALAASLGPGATYATLKANYANYTDLQALATSPGQYGGSLPVGTTVTPVVGQTTWYGVEHVIQTWANLESYGSWAALQNLGAAGP